MYLNIIKQIHLTIIADPEVRKNFEDYIRHHIFKPGLYKYIVIYEDKMDRRYK